MKVYLIIIVLLAFSLRFFGQRLSPPGFTADESIYGYNAYSLLKYGTDQFGTKFPVSLRAFGDYRPALYSYLTVPFVAILGLTETATRLLSILAGTFTVLVTYLLAKKLLHRQLVALLAAFLVAAAPSHILISRYADMSPLSTLFLGLGVWLFFSRPILSSLSFALAAYSYDNARMTGPLLLLVLISLYFPQFKRHFHQFLLAAGLGLILLAPLLLFLIRSPNLIMRRGLYESFMSQKGYMSRLTSAVSSDPSHQSPLITRFLHNKPKAIFQEFIERYLSHFSPNFLFLTGDTHERFQTPGSGVYNLAFALLLPLGFIIALRRPNLRILPAWLLISPLISSSGLFTPNSLHILDSVIPTSTLASLGLFALNRHLRFLIVVIFLYSAYQFFHGYFITLPHTPPLRWNWFPQTRQFVNLVNQVPSGQNITVVGSRNFHQFFLFYHRLDPQEFQRTAIVSSIPDSNGFEPVERLGNLHFLNQISSDQILPGQWLIFDQDSLPLNPAWHTSRCLKQTVTDFTGQDLYFLIYVHPDCLNSN